MTIKIDQPVVKTLIARLHQAAKLNADKQESCDWGSAEWHAHETIDDIIFEALSALGD